MAKNNNNSKTLDHIESRAMEKLRTLIAKGKQKGSLSYKDIMDHLEAVEMTEEQIDEIYELFGNLGIDITDSEADAAENDEDSDDEDFEVNILEG
ncbi:MAG: RNA polymerase sigma factor region1.1 domain-containing protein, partial [Firmicutes bacterium]|nr:RNA polymerase sigma factor region1.1 domain-containing protein [Bacillota bacterium]